jgi:hypothetical protein
MGVRWASSKRRQWEAVRGLILDAEPRGRVSPVRHVFDIDASEARRIEVMRAEPILWLVQGSSTPVTVRLPVAAGIARAVRGRAGFEAIVQGGSQPPAITGPQRP